LPYCISLPLQDIVEVTRDLPEALAEFGRVQISRKQVARLIGQVFLQRSAVNLLGVVLDVPEFFWSAPDHLQVRDLGVYVTIQQFVAHIAVLC
jgi:uncharacterized Rmd1/YagE family protein